MSKLKIELNRSAVGALLKSAEVMKACQEQANQVSAMAGSGYATSQYTGKTRVNVSVFADSDEAKRDNRENHTLERLVGGAR